MSRDKIPKALMEVWGKQCKDGDYVFLSFRDPTKSPEEPGRWRDEPIPFGVDVVDEIKDRLDKYPPEKYDVYFCPLPFTEPKRRKENVRGSKFLWSDMDEIHPHKIEVSPTLYWKSSHQRYQGLWELDRFLRAEEAAEINKALTYKIGADKGGWDLTQVLRVPGTYNHKYKQKPTVGPFTRIRKKLFNLDELKENLSKQEEKKEELEEGDDLDPVKILARYKKVIPRNVLNKLTTKNVEVGKRSDVIWWLEHKLREAGLGPREIYALIKYSAWNKYKGRADEDERLTKELIKILDKEQEEPDSPLKEPDEDTMLEAGLGLRVESFQEVMSNLKTFPGWLVEGFWMRRSHGIVAGEPKSFKSVLTLDLAVSVASGESFLGQFPVLEKGPVIIVQNENADWIMKDRLEKIITHKGLVGNVESRKNNIIHVTFPPILPLHFINQQGFLLNDEKHQEILEKYIEEVRPLLVMFDPLYLMFDGDVNSAKDLNPVLNWMLHLKNEYNTGVIAIHHWNKGSGRKGVPARGGQRMLGSTTLHGWVESAWYVGVKGEEEGPETVEVEKSAGKPISIVMDREFRAGGTRPKVEASIRIAEVGEPEYSVTVKKHVGKSHANATETLKFHIVNILDSYEGPVSLRKLAEDTGSGRRAIGRALDALSEEGVINRTSEGVHLLKKPDYMEATEEEEE